MKIVNLRNANCKILIDRRSIYGNPFRIGQHGDRSQVIMRYREYFYDRIAKDEKFLRAVLDLRYYETWGCWCKPEPCHGDVIREFLQLVVE
jgi:hypothetical protein